MEPGLNGAPTCVMGLTSWDGDVGSLAGGDLSGKQHSRQNDHREEGSRNIPESLHAGVQRGREASDEGGRG